MGSSQSFPVLRKRKSCQGVVMNPGSWQADMLTCCPCLTSSHLLLTTLAGDCSDYMRAQSDNHAKGSLPKIYFFLTAQFYCDGLYILCLLCIQNNAVERIWNTQAGWLHSPLGYKTLYIHLPDQKYALWIMMGGCNVQI